MLDSPPTSPSTGENRVEDRCQSGSDERETPRIIAAARSFRGRGIRELRPTAEGSSHRSSRDGRILTNRLLSRRLVTVFAFFALIFVLQAALVPYDFFDEYTEAGANELFGATRNSFTLPDIISNIFLYVPIGFLFHAMLLRWTRRTVPSLLLTLVLAALLSGSVEWIQAYSPLRVSSIIDFVSNCLGALLGAIISCIGSWILPQLIGAALYEYRASPSMGTLKIYCGVLLLFAVIPFSFSFDIASLKKSVRSATFVPFSSVQSEGNQADESPKADTYWAYSYLRWARMKHWSRWAGECASFVLLVFLLVAFLRGYCGFGRGATFALVWWLAGGYAIILSLIQFPILSRGFDSTDILFRWLGVLLGCCAHPFVAPRYRAGAPAVRLVLQRRLLMWGAVATLAYIAYVGVIPATFSRASGGFAGSLSSPNFIPFHAYFVTRFDLMMDDIMEKFCMYGVFAALLAASWKQAGAWSLRRRAIAIAAIGVAVSIPIEIVQMYIPIRVTSLTDLFLAFVGCASGVFVQDRARTFSLFATLLPASSLSAAAPEREHERRMPPADALVASLTDPKADAPVETSPQKQPGTAKPL